MSRPLGRAAVATTTNNHSATIVELERGRVVTMLATGKRPDGVASGAGALNAGINPVHSDMPSLLGHALAGELPLDQRDRDHAGRVELVEEPSQCEGAPELMRALPEQLVDQVLTGHVARAVAGLP